MNDNATTTEQKQKDDYEVDTNLYTIGGTVWKMAQGNETPKRKPWKQVRVEVKDTGIATQTDDKGRYKLNRLRPGEYTLIIRKKATPPESGIELAQQTITIRQAPFYDIEVTDAPVSQKPPGMSDANTEKSAEKPTGRQKKT